MLLILVVHVTVCVYVRNDLLCISWNKIVLSIDILLEWRHINMEMWGMYCCVCFWCGVDVIIWSGLHSCVIILEKILKTNWLSVRHQFYIERSTRWTHRSEVTRCCLLRCLCSYPKIALYNSMKNIYYYQSTTRIGHLTIWPLFIQHLWMEVVGEIIVCTINLLQGPVMKNWIEQNFVLNGTYVILFFIITLLGSVFFCVSGTGFSGSGGIRVIRPVASSNISGV